RRISGPLVLVLPETTELTAVIEPAVVLVRASPPPPVLAAEPLALFPVIVLFCASIDPLPEATTTPPPELAAELPVSVQFWSSRVRVRRGGSLAPPARRGVLLWGVLLGIPRVRGVNPAGGVGWAAPPK